MLILKIDNYSIFSLLIVGTWKLYLEHILGENDYVFKSLLCVGNQMMNNKACGSHGLCSLGTFQELSTSSVSEKIFSSIKKFNKNTWYMV